MRRREGDVRGSKGIMGRHILRISWGRDSGRVVLKVCGRMRSGVVSKLNEREMSEMWSGAAGGRRQSRSLLCSLWNGAAARGRRRGAERVDGRIISVR